MTVHFIASLTRLPALKEGAGLPCSGQREVIQPT